MTNLRKFRASLGLKQQELAEKIGLSQVYISQMESGVRPITDEIRCKIEDVFGEGCLDEFECDDILPLQDNAEGSESQRRKTITSNRDTDLIASLRETIDILKEQIAKQNALYDSLQVNYNRLLNKVLGDAEK